MPSGKITTWRVSFIRSTASRTSFFSAAEWPSRSTTIIPAFNPCQPNTGTISSSFFITKQASGSRANWLKTSNIDWCLGATRADPVGRYCSPRTSTLIPASQRRPQIRPLDQVDSAQVLTPRGSGRVSSMARAVNTDQIQKNSWNRDERR